MEFRHTKRFHIVSLLILSISLLSEASANDIYDVGILLAEKRF